MNNINFRQANRITVSLVAPKSSQDDVHPDKKNEDKKVRQMITNENSNKPLLLSFNDKDNLLTSDEIAYKNNSIYANPSNGTITATNFDGKINNHTINKDVPSNAVFTDTTYNNEQPEENGTDVSLVLTGEKYIWNNKANISSPSFTGIPTAPTPQEGNNTTQIATTEFVQTTVSSYAPDIISDVDIDELFE